MFTDIVGYTALMGQNREKALILVRTNRRIQKELIAKHNGLWLKEMGDGSLSCFETALDAVNCAIEIQKAARERMDIKLRIGIHLGDITMEEGEVYGDGVNVASRLESMADTGSIVISESIEQAIRGQSDIRTLYLGESQLKNVDYGVRTYAVQGEGLPPVASKKKSKRYTMLLMIAILLVVGIFGISKLAGFSDAGIDQWVGEWQFVYFYENDSTLIYTGTLSCTQSDSLVATFEIRAPKSNRSDIYTASLTLVTDRQLEGIITYRYGIGGGFMKESFSLNLSKDGQFTGSGVCLEFCAEGTENVEIKWLGERLPAQ